MSPFHPLPDSNAKRYYTIRSVVRFVFWTSAFIGAISLINIVTGVRY